MLNAKIKKKYYLDGPLISLRLINSLHGYIHLYVTITIQSLIRVAYVQQNFKTANVDVYMTRLVFIDRIIYLSSLPYPIFKKAIFEYVLHLDSHVKNKISAKVAIWKALSEQGFIVITIEA